MYRRYIDEYNLRGFQRFVERHIDKARTLEVWEVRPCSSDCIWGEFRIWVPALLTAARAPYLERATGLVLRSWEQLDMASLPRSIRALRFSCYINPVTDLELFKCLLQLPNLNELRLSVSR